MLNDYLDYEDYVLYRDKIPNFPDYQGSDVGINDFLSTQSIEKNIEQSIFSYCRIIKIYINNVKAKKLNDSYKCGNFIKYWIKAKIEEEHNNESENIFNYLNEYVKTLNSDPHVNQCTFEFESSDDKNYEKIEYLYNIYNEYWLIIHWITNNHPGAPLCTYIPRFINNYNTLIKTLKVSEDKDLLTKLHYIRYLCERNKSISDKKCSKEFDNVEGENGSNAYELFCKSYESLDKKHNHTTLTENELAQSADLENELEKKGDLEKDLVIIYARSNTNRNVIITTVLISILIGTIFLYFYKFTESWKNTRLRIKRKNRKSMDMEDKLCEYITCKYEGDDGVPDEKEYNIIYTSAR
ncbi:variable surface protein [Plasmodium gonderi]|uniref:Variable surface protein n=1 Tax=Plasmodium gonderi TaxID=77519 RepID=A0A1Y1JQC7_PLAGO|nr:variable surface protein [Plasmodium gonderi]GAW84701.1 variable surface protein [Plasmodium gonderi]